MDKRGAAQELLLLVDQTRTAESSYFSAQHKVALLKFELLGTECDLINSDRIKGKNESLRSAEMWPSTKELRQRIIGAEREEDILKNEYYHLRRKLDVMKLILQNDHEH